MSMTFWEMRRRSAKRELSEKILAERKEKSKKKVDVVPEQAVLKNVEYDLEAMTLKELREFAEQNCVSLGEARKKSEIIAILAEKFDAEMR